MSVSVDNTTVQQYRMDPTRFVTMRRTMIVRAALLLPLLLAVCWYFDARLDHSRNVFDFVGLPLIMAWVVYKGVQRERDKWSSLVLEFRDNSLIRTLPGYPLLEIAPSEVTRMVDFSGGIIVRTESRRKTLIVGSDLLGYEDFRNRLVAWAPTAKVEQRNLSLRGIISVLGCILIFGGPVYLMYTPHHELILPLGAASFAGMVTIILYSQGSPNVPTSVQKTSWVLLLLPLLATISRLMGSR